MTIAPNVLISPPAPWMNWLLSHLGEKEQTGAAATPFDIEVFSHTNFGSLQGTMEAGCAATLCAALEETGRKSPHNAAAISFKDFGILSEYKFGAILVFRWADGSHHVSTCYAYHPETGTVACLGGNQSHNLQVSVFPTSRVIAVRWPNELLANKVLG